ncbi:uroporphyrinogen-III synthase [Heyndrickxia sp. NPDC080065]|uniref:uroporphyrinogen-III synthase n=1 Tax=Heyndrickxia sp. NPDC080065 TaxID=3390568 RepID=UPI003D08FBE0
MIDGLPLQGKKILVTRGGEKGNNLASKITEFGGVSFVTPLIDFELNQDLNAATYIEKLDFYDWIIFTSQNGVDFFFKELKRLYPGLTPSKIKNHIAAVGSKTKKAIEKYHVYVDFYPKKFSAADFLVQFIEEVPLPNQVLIPKGNLASKTIAEGLEKKKVIVDEWIVYNTFFPKENKEKLVEILQKNDFNYATFTSPSTFHHFMEIVKEYSLQKQISGIEFVTIGAVTKKTVEDYGYSVAVSPEIYTIDSMLDRLCRLTIQEEEIK